LVIGGAVYGSGLAWAYFSNRALQTGQLVVKAEPKPEQFEAIAEAVDSTRGEV